MRPSCTNLSPRIIEHEPIFHAGPKFSGTLLCSIISIGICTIPMSVAAGDPKDAHSRAQYDWTGLYFGAEIGRARGANSWNYPADELNSISSVPAGSALAVSSGSDYSAPVWSKGIALGYNKQFGNWVVGLEAGLDWVNSNSIHRDPSFSNLNQTTQNHIAMLAMRGGYAWNHLMLYAKTGLALSRETYSSLAVNSYLSGGTPPQTLNVVAGSVQNKASVNRFGLLLGGGAEYALDPNWSVKGEFNYINWGTQRVTLAPSEAGVTAFDEDIYRNSVLFKLGVNYKVNGASVVKSDATTQERRPRFGGSLEYLSWRAKAAPLSVPLLAGSNDPNNTEGLLINSNTTILYGAPFSPAIGGSAEQPLGTISGKRLTFSYSADDANRVSVEGSGFLMQRRTAGYSIQGDATGNPGMRVPVYTLPYLGEGQPGFGAGQGEDGVPVSVPEDLMGGYSAINSLQFWGADIGGVVGLHEVGGWKVAALGGFRHFNLSESFNQSVNLQGLSGTEFANQRGVVSDSFATRNAFYGMMLGLRSSLAYGPFAFEGTGKISVGVNHQTLSIAGSYSAENFYNQSGPYGIFAMPSNSGTSSRNVLAVAPELQAKLAYNITPNTAITLGYDVVYLSNVIRPTDQINRFINKGQVFQQDTTQPGPSAVPTRFMRSTDFWEHGLSVGLKTQF